MKALTFCTLLAAWIATEVGRADPLDTWIRQSQPTNANDLLAVAYGKGQFAAVGFNRRILTSGDGINWVGRQSETGGLLRGIAFGLGQFVAVGWDPGSF